MTSLKASLIPLSTRKLLAPITAAILPAPPANPSPHLPLVDVDFHVVADTTTLAQLLAQHGYAHGGIND